MTACDGLSFRVIVKSPDMRRLMLLAGFSDFPRSQTALKNIVLRHAQKLRTVVSTELQQLRKMGKHFSVTFDEWTSVRNRRYMCVNVHADGPKFWSLGLVRVWGSMPSEKCIELLRCRLTAFGLNLDTDIVAICTDGASVMCRVGKLLSAEHQQCIVHGIHLAVQDVLYKATSESTLPAEGASASGCSTATALTAAVEDEINRGDSDSEDDVEEVGLDVELTCNSSSAKDHHHTDEQTQEVQEEMTLTFECDADDECFQVQEDADDIGYNLSELSPEYRKTVAKVRKTVKLFRKSPTKNDSVLQKKCCS